MFAKLDQPASFISAKLQLLTAFSPVGYGITEFERARQLAEIIGFRDLKDCLHTAIAERHYTDFYTCNYKDFKRTQPHTVLKIHFL